MLRNLWDNLKAIVQSDADRRIKSTSDVHVQEAIRNQVEAFLCQPSPNDHNELLLLNGQAIKLQGEMADIFNAQFNVPGGGVAPTANSPLFGDPKDRVPGQTEAVFGVGHGPQATPGQSDVTWGQ
jgi:hypothetical protein